MAIISPSLLLGAAGLWIAGTLLYRFFFHPLAAFPGPKFAIATYLYEWYYDLYQDGQYCFKLKALHEKYGPVIRMNPDTLHVGDIDLYDEVWNASSGKLEKPENLAHAYGPSQAIIGTVDHDLHKMRRAAMSPFFSRKSVVELVPHIQTVIDRLCGRLDRASETGELLNMRYFYAALTIDVIYEYCFAVDSGVVMRPDFGEAHSRQFWAFIRMSFANYHIPSLFSYFFRIPESIRAKLSVVIQSSVNSKRGLGETIDNIKMDPDRSNEKFGHRTIFHELLQSRLPPEELETQRLSEDAYSLTTAGSVSTAHNLRNMTYYLAANPAQWERAKEEIYRVLPERSSHASLTDLEQLPYLTAVIQESLRLSRAITMGSPRRLAERSLIYKGKTIPPKTAMMGFPEVFHMDADVYPDPYEFRPERWLDLSPAEKSRLNKYSIPFARGPRNCVGINLAWAEMYLVLAHVMRRFEIDVSRVVKERDVDTVRNIIGGETRADSLGMLVTVKKRD